MKTRHFASFFIVIALAAAGCMTSASESDAVSGTTNVQGLHPAGMTLQTTDVGSSCSRICNLMHDCEMLSDMTVEQCIQACNGGAFTGYMTCLEAAVDCYDLMNCF